jgi:competence protein ComFC
MCGIELISEKGTCLRCRSAEYTFHSHLSLFPYTGMAKCLLQALKFGGRRRLAGFFSCRAAYELEYRLKVREASAAIVPVPSRPGRKEPDAVELIARTLQSDHGLDVRRVLLRTAATQQKSLDYEQRRENLRGGIQVHPRFSGAVPRRVVLLDDVFTTGATLDACSRVLLQSGCQRVDALTLAMEE